MRERGIAIEVKAGRALVEVEPGEGCGHGCAGCRVEGKPDRRRVELESPPAVRPGASVTLEVRAGQLVLSSVILFLMPLALFVLGAALSRSLLSRLGLRTNPDLGMMACGAVGFAVGLGLAVLIERLRGRRGRLKPRIVEIDGVPV